MSPNRAAKPEVRQVEVWAPSVELARNVGSEALDASEHDVSSDVVEETRQFLGFGRKQLRVLVKYAPLHAPVDGKFVISFRDDRVPSHRHTSQVRRHARDRVGRSARARRPSDSRWR